MLSDFSAQMTELAQRSHVLVVDTPDNRRAAEVLSAGGAYDRTHGVTTFTVQEGELPEDSVVNLLAVIDEHHGLRAEWATDVVLEVRGASLTPTIRLELETLGPFDVQEDTVGFIVRRTPGGATRRAD
jgi:hypothetical protein